MNICWKAVANGVEFSFHIKQNKTICILYETNAWKHALKRSFKYHEIPRY